MSIRESFDWRDLAAAILVSIVAGVLVCTLARTLTPMRVLGWAIMTFAVAYPTLVSDRPKKRAWWINS